MDTRRHLPFAPLFNTNLCVYCGSPADTNDHAPPRCLLTEPVPNAVNLVTLPACRRCNNEYSKDENLVKAILCNVSFEYDLRVQTKAGGKVYRAMQRDYRLRQRVDGAFDENGWFHVDKGMFDALDRVFKKAVIGLYFARYGVIVCGDQIVTLNIDHSKRISPAEMLLMYTKGSLWPEVTPDGRALEVAVKASFLGYVGTEWHDYCAGVLRYVFARHAEGRLLCVVDSWGTISAAFLCPWPSRRGPVVAKITNRR